MNNRRDRYGMETSTVVEELATKVKVPKEVKEGIYDKLFKNVCIAIVVLLYFMFLNMGYIAENIGIFENDLHTFAGILIISTIVVFEIAYRRDSSDIALVGVELLCVSVITLFMPYVYLHRGVLLKFIYSIFSLYMTVYYLVKCLVIYVIEVKKYRANLSDIKEIVVDESKKTYLDEKNERKFEEDE